MKLHPIQLARSLLALAAGTLALAASAYTPMPFPADGDGLPDSRLPQLSSSVEAVYPAQLLDQRIEGDVWVAFVVGSTGEPLKVRAFFGRHAELEKAAEEAVKQWRFTPGIACGGRPVHTQMIVSIHFAPPPSTASSQKPAAG